MGAVALGGRLELAEEESGNRSGHGPGISLRLAPADDDRLGVAGEVHGNEDELGVFGAA